MMQFATVRRGMRLEALAFSAVAIAALTAGVLSFRAPAAEPEPGAQATVTLTKARQLVAATTGEAAAQITAIGDQAKLINASLPFSSAPLLSARPFAVSGTATDHDRALLCMTQAVYYEAGFEPLTGRRAVAQVVLNRMRHPAFPKSVCGVVYQGSGGPVCQFSFVCDGSLYRAPAAGAWKQARDVAEAALEGYVERSVGQATHYHADYVAPRWAPMLTKIAQLGAHIFYRWPGSWGMPGAFNGRYIGEPRDPLSMRPPLRIAKALPGEVLAVEQAVARGPVTDGSILKRAQNDVGGLLDVSKGWTLNIPGPDAGSATRAIAAQQGTPVKAVAETSPIETSAASSGAVIASR
jgi:spore germination cell wall hydrolase CwlJ-like protein